MTARVCFDRVSKKFRRGELHDSLRDLLAAGVNRLLRRGARPSPAEFWALREVSFEVGPGEALGIIGPNGAGKSTALKLLAGILRADGGRVEMQGRLSALIEVSAGMHGDLTGRENIYLNGAIIGMTRREIDTRLDDIIAFAGIEEFIDTPVKRYSTGMQARLGFATAAHVRPDVLLVDEVLAVGDVAFRQRCEERMTQLVRDGAALVFVTHNLEQMRSVCHRALVLDAGQCVCLAPPAEAVTHYLNAMMNRTGALTYMDQPRTERTPADQVELRFLDAAGREVLCAGSRQPLRIEVTFRLSHPVPHLGLEIALRRYGGEMVVNFNSGRDEIGYAGRPGLQRVCLDVPGLPLATGTYGALVRLWDVERARLLGETPHRFTLQIDDSERCTGLFSVQHEWSALEPVAAEPVDSATELVGAA